jgi:hypothetical protein
VITFGLASVLFIIGGLDSLFHPHKIQEEVIERNWEVNWFNKWTRTKKFFIWYLRVMGVLACLMGIAVLYFLFTIIFGK